MIELRFARLVIAVTAITFPLLATAHDEPAPKARSLTAAQCERLVEQLANPNERPFKEDYVLDLPGDLDQSTLHKTQEPIAAAYNDLSANIEVSLPVLLAHLSDKRFSYVYEQPISGVYRCQSIGGACRKIIDTHVSVYSQAVSKQDEEGRPRSLWFRFDEHGGFEKWLTDRRGRTLAELQAEQIEWALRQTQPEHLSKSEWDTAKESLTKMAEQIRAGKKPIRVDHKVQFFSK